MKKVYIFFLLPLFAFILFTIIIPLLLIFYNTFTYYGIEKLGELFSIQSYALKSLLFTIFVATLSTLFSVIIGYGIALYMILKRKYIKIVMQLLRIPLFIPYITIGYIWRAFLNPRGHGTMIASMIASCFNLPAVKSLVGTGWAINIAHTWLYIPVVFSITYAVLLKINPEIIDAARSLGAKGLTLVTRIYIPLTWRAVLAAFVLVFMGSLRGVSIPLILGSNPDYFPVYIYRVLTDYYDKPLANALSFVFFIISATLAFIYFKLALRIRKTGV